MMHLITVITIEFRSTTKKNKTEAKYNLRIICVAVFQKRSKSVLTLLCTLNNVHSNFFEREF